MQPSPNQQQLDNQPHLNAPYNPVVSSSNQNIRHSLASGLPNQRAPYQTSIQRNTTTGLVQYAVGPHDHQVPQERGNFQQQQMFHQQPYGYGHVPPYQHQQQPPMILGQPNPPIWRPEIRPVFGQGYFQPTGPPSFQHPMYQQYPPQAGQPHSLPSAASQQGGPGGEPKSLPSYLEFPSGVNPPLGSRENSADGLGRGQTRGRQQVCICFSLILFISTRFYNKFSK